VVNDDTPLGIEDEIMLHACEREIAAKLAPMVDHRRARGQDFDYDDQIDEKSRVIG
jgi:hypothetical protein